MTFLSVVTDQEAKKGVGRQRKAVKIGYIFYVLSFKPIAIMASYCFFIHMNVKKFKSKVHLIKI
jgi:hypothetical protein